MSGKVPVNKRHENRFQQVCPRQLQNLPQAPCHLALERIAAIQSQKDKKTKDIDAGTGCSWYCTSADANYCFFSLIKSDAGPYNDEDVGILLSMSSAQVNKTYESAIGKLRSEKNSQDMQDLAETLREVTSRQTDNTVYLPDNFLTDQTFSKSLSPASQDGAEDNDDAEAAAEVGLKKTKAKAKKTQLYGLYSQETLKRIKLANDEALQKRLKDSKK